MQILQNVQRWEIRSQKGFINSGVPVGSVMNSDNDPHGCSMTESTGNHGWKLVAHHLPLAQPEKPAQLEQSDLVWGYPTIIPCFGVLDTSPRHCSAWALLHSSTWRWSYQNKSTCLGLSRHITEDQHQQKSPEKTDAWRSHRDSAYWQQLWQNQHLPICRFVPHVSPSLVAPQGVLQPWLDARKMRSQAHPFPRHQIIWVAWKQPWPPAFPWLTAPYNHCAAGTGTGDSKGEWRGGDTDTHTYTRSQG